MNGTEFSRTDLTELHRQLGAWRQRQRGRPRLPEEVWDAAAVLVATEGVSQVARTLRLDYYKLRRRCTSTPAIAPRVKGLPGFVELHVDEAVRGNAGPFRVELAGARGVRMTIELGHDTSAVVALAEAFWKGVP